MSIYINAKGTLDKVCSKTHFSFMFDIRDHIDKLHIEFQFEPDCLEDKEESKKIIGECLNKYSIKKIEDIDSVVKHFTPIRNLLTISLDGPNGFKGAAHRHCVNQHHTISSDVASPGFLPGDIELGMWTVTISVHAIATEYCNYEIKVYGE